MFIKHSQQDIDFDIPSTLFNVGIKISGGADSAILCYILAKYKAEVRPNINIHPITVVNIIKPYQLIKSKAVIKFCENEFNIKFAEHQTCDAMNEHVVVTQHKLLDCLYKSNLIDCHAVGITLNPPQNELTAHMFKYPESRDIKRDYNGQIKETTFIGNNSTSVRPFVNIDKQGIAELYQHFGLLDNLFPLTKSCEGYTLNWNSPHCGKCWWCQERQWGFNRLV